MCGRLLFLSWSFSTVLPVAISPRLVVVVCLKVEGGQSLRGSMAEEIVFYVVRSMRCSRAVYTGALADYLIHRHELRQKYSNLLAYSLTLLLHDICSPPAMLLKTCEMTQLSISLIAVL